MYELFRSEAYYWPQSSEEKQTETDACLDLPAGSVPVCSSTVAMPVPAGAAGSGRNLPGPIIVNTEYNATNIPADRSQQTVQQLVAGATSRFQQTVQQLAAGGNILV
jgi:hypothetical protein